MRDIDPETLKEDKNCKWHKMIAVRNTPTLTDVIHIIKPSFILVLGIKYTD